MHRFTDPILFLALFVLDALAWWILEATSGIAATQEGLTPMTVAVAVVIAAPALLFAFVAGLARALADLEPRRFYAWASGAAIVATLIFGLASPLTQSQGIEVGFAYDVWFMGLLALAFVIALVVAITGGIPAPKQPERPAPAPKRGPETRAHGAGDIDRIPPVRPGAAAPAGTEEDPGAASSSDEAPQR